jgi:hypothetical protein
MDVTLPLDKMSVEEKLRALELLWEDLTRSPAVVPSPRWHQDVLEAREQRLRAGQEAFVPWDKARESLRPPHP